jgi:hypothetical protein
MESGAGRLARPECQGAGYLRRNWHSAGSLNAPSQEIGRAKPLRVPDQVHKAEIDVKLGVTVEQPGSGITLRGRLARKKVDSCHVCESESASLYRREPSR